MGFESLHAAAAEGDDQELKKRTEGLDIDRLQSIPKLPLLLHKIAFAGMGFSIGMIPSPLSSSLRQSVRMADTIRPLQSMLRAVWVTQRCIKQLQRGKMLPYHTCWHRLVCCSRLITARNN